MPVKEFIIKRKKIIISIVVLIAFFLIGSWLGRRTKKNALPSTGANIENQAKAPAPPKNIYSRISFFITSPVNGSLAIPEAWEGKYRTKEEGNKISLDYIGDPSLETAIFYVKFYNIKEWDGIAMTGKTKEKELQRKDDLVYVYNIAVDNPYKGDNQIYFKNMAAEASQIIQSLRLFRNN